MRDGGGAAGDDEAGAMMRRTIAYAIGLLGLALPPALPRLDPRELVGKPADLSLINAYGSNAGPAALDAFAARRRRARQTHRRKRAR